MLTSSFDGFNYMKSLKVKLLAQSCLNLCDSMDCSLPGSSLHGILQARVLEWVAISFSKGSSRPRDWTRVSRIPGRRFNLWATREAHEEFSSVQFSLSLQPHGLHHARLPCPLPTSGAYSNSYSSSWWCILILCLPLLLPPLIFPIIRVFPNESVLRIRWLKYWSFSFSISPSNEYSGLISFRMDMLNLLAAQETLKIFSNTTVQKHRFFSAHLSL